MRHPFASLRLPSGHRPLPVVVSAALALLLTTGCLQVHVPPEEGPSPAAGAAEEPGEAGTEGEGPRAGAEDAEDDPFEDWDEVLEETEEISGYLTFHLKRDQSLYLEIPEDRLGREFGMLTHFSRGLGDLGIQEGLPAYGGTQLMELQRRGDRIYFVRKNHRFTAEPGTGMERSLEENVGHSVLAAWDIESRHDSTGNLLVEVTDFFVSDYAYVGQALQGIYGGGPVRLDDARSHVERVMGFPENVEIDAFLTYSAEGAPSFGGPGLSDVRSIPVGVRYSLFALPSDPMPPRLADLRVGHFITARRDFSRDREKSTYLRWVNRWRLEKADHSQPVSEPAEPIVFYVDRSVPDRYRPYVHDGIEAWNKAFRAAGFDGAVVARDAPSAEEDPSWSAEDVRYSTVRWTAAHSMGYAIGPSQTDPRTGEILNADILISWIFVRGWMNEWQEMVADGNVGALALPGGTSGADAPSATGESAAPGTGWGTFARSPSAADRAGPAGLIRSARRLQASLFESRPGAARHLCVAELHRLQQLAIQYAVLVARGEVAPGEPMPEEYLGAAIKDLVMHEVGHTLGLRHNFRASSDIPYDRLHDEDFTDEHGVSLSVMDYVPVNVAVDGEQGHYFNREVGSYDAWAIRYAYTPVYEGAGGAAGAAAAGGAGATEGELPSTGTPVSDPFAEREALDRIAALSDDGLRAYGTDEDASFGPFGVDPLTNRNDLGSDPLRYARDRGRLVADVMPDLEARLVAEGDYWDRLRGGVTALLYEEYSALSHLPKMVGGLYFVRDHRGQPGGRTPFRPVEAERQRAAVETLAERAFAPGAFGVDAELLNRLSPERWFDWSAGFTDMVPTDFPVHRQVASLQGFLLSDLLHPERLHRMVDAPARAEGEEVYTMGELFGTLTGAIWSEVTGSGSPREMDSFRRNLQRAHLSQLEDLLLMDEVPGFGGTVSVPEDARSLARLELSELSERLDAVLASEASLSRETRAHLAESKARIDRALEASLVVNGGDEG